MQAPPSKELWKKYNDLPNDLRQAILSTDTTEKIQAIVKKYQITSEKIRELDDEIGLTMLGFNHPRDFITNLVKRLGIDKETARKIAEEVNQQIFQKVRESLRKLHGLDQEIKVTENVSGMPRPPQTPPYQGGEKGVVNKPPPPPKIVITEDEKIAKTAPKEELKPLEIRPIKGGQLGGGEPEEKKIPTPPQSPPYQGGEKGVVPKPPEQSMNVFGNQPAPKKLSEIMHEPVKIPPRPQLDFPPRRTEEAPEQKFAGLRVMPHSVEEIKKPAKSPADISAGKPPQGVIPTPPPGLAFKDDNKGDPYREKI